MRVFAGAVCLLAASVISVCAADITPPPYPPPAPPPVYAPPPPPLPPPYNWSGFYIGGNAGWGFASGTGTATASGIVCPPFSFCVPFTNTASSSGTLDGAIAGGQIGFNWQINSLVFGIEADGEWSNQSTTNTIIACAGLCTLTETTGINWFATARARVGYAIDNILIYGTAGAAWINASDKLTGSEFGLTANIASLSSSALGYAVGGGMEVGFTPNISARFEYLFISSSNFTATTTVPLIAGTVSEKATINDSIVRAGVNFRLPVGWL